jgi:nucleoside-diphosphate-sugar epimerase
VLGTREQSVLTNPWMLPESDLKEGVALASADLLQWSGSRILLTGGTGFLGSWLLSSLLTADADLALDLDVTVLTRDPVALPGISSPRVHLLQGDVRGVDLPGEYDLIVHAAAGASTQFGIGDAEPRKMISTVVTGTEKVIECAARTRARLLFVSSGAVYGPLTIAASEDMFVGPDPLDTHSAYGESKRLAETMCAAATAAGEVDAVIVRFFAFIGPRIPLDSYYAAGNFLADALGKRPISVSGTGQPVRSYLYCGDLPEWCWAAASRGTPGRAYNVGSNEPVTIAELARSIGALTSPPCPVEIEGGGQHGTAPRYVPDITRATAELGVRPRTSLEDGLRATYEWLGGGYK